jgi:hypothetical protein
MSGRVALLRGWSLWPLALVRGAGFPVRLVGGLAAPALAAVADQVLEGTKGEAAFVEAWSTARPSLRAAVRAFAADPRLREAVTWQNRSAVENGLDSLVRAPADRDDAKLRKKEAMVVSYLQRYATKCDTIGFFGPLGWARWAGQAAVTQRPGAALLDARAVFFEPWAIAAVVDALSGDDEALQVTPVRLTGHARVALLPQRSVERRVAAAIDGLRTPRAIASALGLPRARATPCRTPTTSCSVSRCARRARAARPRAWACASLQPTSRRWTWARWLATPPRPPRSKRSGAFALCWH